MKPAPEDAAALLYTSGTTGEPKGVVLSHRNVLSNVLALQSIIEQTIARPEEHRSLSFLPWAHAFGHTVELHVMIAGGACIAIAEAVEKVVDDIREVRPTVLVAVPMVFLRIHAGVARLMTSRPRFVRWLFERGVRLSLRRSRGEALSLSDRALLAAADALVFSRIRARFGGRLRFAICGAAALVLAHATCDCCPWRMKTPITSCPCSRSRWAATLESTPPDIASTTRAIVQV